MILTINLKIMPGEDLFAKKWENEMEKEPPIPDNTTEKELESKLKGLTPEETEEYKKLSAELEKVEVTTPEAMDNDPRAKRLKELLELAQKRQNQ